MAPRTRFSLAQARRIALAAQGFHEGRPAAATKRHLSRVLQRSHLLQIDSVNVLVRAHYMPLFSRLGAYDRGPSRKDRLSPQEARKPSSTGATRPR